jgi:DNA polymerase/3'-5' exonuclease PolX
MKLLVSLLASGEGFKARAYRKSAGIIAAQPKKVEAGKELKNIAGIGKATMDKVGAIHCGQGK